MKTEITLQNYVGKDDDNRINASSLVLTEAVHSSYINLTVWSGTINLTIAVDMDELLRAVSKIKF